MPARGWAAAGTSSCGRWDGGAMQVLWLTETVGRHRACCRDGGPTAKRLEYRIAAQLSPPVLDVVGLAHVQRATEGLPALRGRQHQQQQHEACILGGMATHQLAPGGWRHSALHARQRRGCRGQDNGQPPLGVACPAPTPLNRASQWAEPPLSAAFNRGAAWPERLCVAAWPGRGAGGASARFGCGRGRRAAAHRHGGGRPCTLEFAGANSWQLGVAHGRWSSASEERERWRLAGWLPLPTRPPGQLSWE